MNRGPQSARAKLDNVAKANEAWGNDVPEWVIVLAKNCSRSGQSTIAKQLDYSPATISQVLSNSYRGDVGRIEQIVRGVLMAETVRCPRLGDIARNVCQTWQRKPFSPTNSQRVRMFHACRDGCPHSRIASEKGDDDDAV